MTARADIAAAQPNIVKVPQVSTIFWIAKILTTGLGETSSDFLVKSLEPLIVIPVTAAALALALALQLLSRRFEKWLYWTSVALVAVFGTMVADAIHVVAGVPYLVSSVGFAVGLAALFVAWSVTEGTLSIHSIATPRREAFYWMAVVVTFALGTAAGDMTASSLRLGYALSGVLFLALFALPLIARSLARLNEALTFWTAYILTRPLGASFADWIGVGHDRGGLGFGTGLISLALLIAVIGVVYLGKFSAAQSVER